VALSNAEKQARWRERHAERRQTVARIASMLTRRSHTEGSTTEAKVGWNTVTFDDYFYTLAFRLADVLKTDRAIMQLRWALHVILWKRRHARWHERTARKIARKRSREQSIAIKPPTKKEEEARWREQSSARRELWLKEHPDRTGDEYEHLERTRGMFPNEIDRWWGLKLDAEADAVRQAWKRDHPGREWPDSINDRARARAWAEQYERKHGGLIVRTLAMARSALQATEWAVDG
jgi:hypothetical protein